MDLSGRWRATPADEDLRRTFHRPDLDDQRWGTTPVPGHWAADPDLRTVESMLYRCRFETPELADNPRRRWWLRFEGIVSQGDVFLDGDYLGDTDGYFVPHQFEITDLLGRRADHLLAVEVTCPRFSEPDNRSLLTGALQDPELCGSTDLVPGGIWRPVTLRATGPTAMAHFRAVCLDADEERARVGLRAVFDSPEAESVVLRTRVADVDHDLVHPAAVGENRVEWTVDIPEPELWWPHALGEPALHDLRVDILVDGEVRDTRQVRIGFRSVALRGWTLRVNGERMFVKGASVLPTRPLPGHASSSEVAADVRAGRDAGLDLVRTVAHVARPELYTAADELGMLVWQDLPVRGVMSRSVRGQARRQAREVVDLLGHHPSIAIWCAHDEPFPRPTSPGPTPPVVGQQRPSWNRAVLDRSLKRVLERTDGSRPVVAHTAVPPHLPTLDGTTSHLWFGWRGGRAADLATALARVPRMGRFVSAFGAASVMAEAVRDSWPAVDWDRLAQACGADADALRRLVSPDAVGDGATWAALTQAAQAEVVKTTIELLRRLKYAPTGGFVLHTLRDPDPAGGFGVLDHAGRRKTSWQALVDACAPVIVVADPLPQEVHRGHPVSAAVHVVSDRRSPLAGAVVEARVLSGRRRVLERRWGGDIPADGCHLIGQVEFHAPQDVGPLTLDLELTAGSTIVTNRYTTRSV